MTTAIAPFTKFKNAIQTADVKKRFEAILADRAPSFMASLLSVVAGNDKLQACTTPSILTAAAKAAILNLPIEPSLGFAYIVPFKNEATFITGYKGLIQMALRTKQYEAINADAIYEGEEVVINRLTGNITINGTRTGDDVQGYFAYFKMKNGYEKFVYMTVDQVREHGKKYSKSYDFNSSAWKTDFGAMARKTVLRQLLTRWGLLSIEMQDDDAINLEAITNDPRLQTPDDVGVPDFGDTDVVEGEFANDIPIEVIEAVVNAGLSENAFSMQTTLALSNINTNGISEVIAWFRLYRGWRDTGLGAEEAAEKANAGEKP